MKDEHFIAIGLSLHMRVASRLGIRRYTNNPRSKADMIATKDT